MNITPDVVRQWMEKGEGKELEYKQGLPKSERIARTLCAFANTRGGVLLVGVTDRGAAYGVPRPREVTESLREVASEYVDPPVELLLRTVRIDDAAIVCCSVPLSPARPHSVERRDGDREVVVRAGASNRRAAGPTLAALTRPSRSRNGLSTLEQRVLHWVESRSRQSQRPGGDATVQAFAKAHNVGAQRARRAFVALEQKGLLVGHGPGAQRTYCAV